MVGEDKAPGDINNISKSCALRGYRHWKDPVNTVRESMLCGGCRCCCCLLLMLSMLSISRGGGGGGGVHSTKVNATVFLHRGVHAGHG